MRILNLGAGVQSTTIYLMMIDGTFPAADYAIFADTGDEPKAVYEHLEYLESLSGPKIIRVTAGNLGDMLLNDRDERKVSIPAFLSNDGTTNNGIGIRQCTKEFKIEPIWSGIRDLIEIKPRCRLPKDSEIVEIFGLSFDEPKRVARVRSRFEGSKNRKCEFPLFEEFMTRGDCVKYLEHRLRGRTVPRSACVFCPYKSDEEWSRLKESDPDGWSRALAVDAAIRDSGTIRAKQYLHRSCQPLELVQLRPKPPDRQSVFQWSEMDCEGMCGN